MRPEEQSWQRPAEPALSADSSGQPWCGVTLYTPMVLRWGETYRMWYIGGDGATRDGAVHLGYAESDDGIAWRPHPANPVLHADDVPWGSNLQTPFVLPDGDGYRMWFISTTEMSRGEDGSLLKMEQELGYATSRDGLSWRVAPAPVYSSGRRPCVLRDVDGEGVRRVDGSGVYAHIGVAVWERGDDD